MPRKTRSSGHKLRVRLRRELVYRLRLEGATYSEIAEQIHGWARGQGWELAKGYDRRHVHQDLERYLAQRERANDSQLRLHIAINLERYQLLLKRVWPQAMRGRLASIDQARKLIKQISHLEQMEHAVGGEGATYDGDMGPGEEEGANGSWQCPKC